YPPCMKKRGRHDRRARLVPKLIFGTLCATSVVPACGSSGSPTSTDAGKGDAHTGGFGGLTVAKGGFGGAAVGAGGVAVAAGGFGGMTVAAGGFGGNDSGLGGFAGFAAVAAGGFGGLPDAGDASAQNDSPNAGNWAVTGAFSDPEQSPFVVAERRQRS